VSILDLVPAEWLHVTMQGIVFTDQIDAIELARVTDSLRGRLAERPRPTVTFHGYKIVKEAVYLEATSTGSLDELQLAVYDAVAAVLPPRVFTRRRPQRGFKPHVSFGYVNSDAPADPIAAALQDVEPEPVTVSFAAASLLELSRDHRMWEWTEVTRLPFRA
jgi:2'-5' RNA ligase